MAGPNVTTTATPGPNIGSGTGGGASFNVPVLWDATAGGLTVGGSPVTVGSNYNAAAVAITGGTLDGLQRVGFSAVAGGASDITLFRDAANTLAQRNGTAAQTTRSYNTFTDANTGEWGELVWGNNLFTLRTVANGTGVIRPLAIQAGSGNSLYLGANGFNLVQLSAAQNILWVNDNTGDIGSTGAGRVRNFYAGTGYRTNEAANGKQGVATLVAGILTVANTNITTNSRIFLTSNTDGGTPGFLRVSARTAGTSFTILSSSGTDTSIVAYEIFEPA